MTDKVDAITRSRKMAGIKGKNTKPELLLRRALHAKGFRYTLHDKKLPGRPDLVFPKYRAVIFVHGCFWHQHPNCKNAVMPKSNTEFWRCKLQGNANRDTRSIAALELMGWKCIVVWECQKVTNELIDELSVLLRNK